MSLLSNQFKKEYKMSMTFVVFFIIFMLLIFVFVAGIVYWAISHANKNNKEYLEISDREWYSKRYYKKLNKSSQLEEE